MPTLSPGAIWMVRQFGTRSFVAQRPVADHLGEHTRYQLVCKRVDARGRSDYQTHVADIDDVVLVHAVEVYAVGSTVSYAGLGVPEHGVQTRGGYVIRIPSGNVRVLHKADLILAVMH